MIKESRQTMVIEQEPTKAGWQLSQKMVVGSGQQLLSKTGD